jgi:Golgi apparatus protein 1
MKLTMHSLARFGLLPVLFAFSLGSESAQSDIAKTIQEKLTAKIAKLESACAKDIKKYCTTVTPGEGRMIYCMQAHEDKISLQCAYELEESASTVQTAADTLKDAILACKAEITGVCGKTVPGQGRIAACLMANRSAASKSCEEAIQRVEAIAAK